MLRLHSLTAQHIFRWYHIIYFLKFSVSTKPYRAPVNISNRLETIAKQTFPEFSRLGEHFMFPDRASKVKVTNTSMPIALVFKNMYARIRSYNTF